MAFKLKVGSIKLIPSTGGVFEVSVNGQSVYSKKATGQFPDQDALVKQIQSML